MNGMRNLFVVAVLAGGLALPGMAIAQLNEGGGRADGAGTAGGGNAGVLSAERGGGGVNGEAAGGRGGGNGGANGTAASDRAAERGRVSEECRAAAERRAAEERAAAERRAMMTNPVLVSRVQQTLNMLGFSAQPLTGTWNRDTAVAMRYFQEAHGLPPTGQLN